MSRPLGAAPADAYVALGANLGRPLDTLRWAAGELGALGEVVAVSGLYRTAPVGGPPGQPDYLNAAAHLRTPLDPDKLLAALHALEARAGRERRQRWEARVLDLDLILYGAVVRAPAEGMTGPTLPHPRAWDRAFVLAPLGDLDPELRHPLTGESVRSALRRVGNVGVTLAAPQWLERAPRERDGADTSPSP